MIDFLGGLVLDFGDAVFDVAAGLLGWLVGFVANVIIMLSAALPSDPFQLPEVMTEWETGLEWLNWFVPVGQIAAIIGAWVAATVAYYAFQFILRHLAASKL